MTTTIDYTWIPVRPVLVVERTGGAKLGNCYHATYFRVTSADRLTRAKLDALRAAGVLGYGQGFHVKGQCDGKEAPAGVDTVPCSAVDRHTRAVISSNAINPYSGKPYGTHDYPYFVYECEDRCDSGD